MTDTRWCIRHGMSRTVLLTPRWAIKLPGFHAWGDGGRGRVSTFCRGVLANQSERRWSGVAGLNPVVWSCGWGMINVYRRAEIATVDVDYDSICVDEFVPPGDRKPSNVGWVDGELVWIDFDFSSRGLRGIRPAKINLERGIA